MALISTHALREEGDTLINSTARLRSISTHALREEGDSALGFKRVGVNISTHALREEGDALNSTIGGKSADFYPRPPRGGRHCRAPTHCRIGSFLPTPSARRATIHDLLNLTNLSVFLPTPSARRATYGGLHQARGLPISTHALREEGDHYVLYTAAGHGEFLPTPSARRATISAGVSCFYTIISTHALREEGDTDRPFKIIQISHFYPRPPRGGRRVQKWRMRWKKIFLPTPSARRATCEVREL